MKMLVSPLKLSVIVFLVLLVTSFASAQHIGDETTCYKASSPPKIDGKLDEWDAKTSVTGYITPDSEFVGQYAAEPLPADAGDCSFEAFAMWDEDNFYIAFAIVDDDPILENPAGFPWGTTSDNVEIYTDPTNKSNAERSDAWAIGPRNGDEMIAVQCDPMVRDAIDFDLAIGVSDGPLKDGKEGWVIELRLGEDSFDPDPITLKPGGIMGMIMVISDVDGGEPRSRMMVPDESGGVPTSASFLLVFSAESVAVSPIGNAATTWGQVKAVD